MEYTRFFIPLDCEDRGYECKAKAPVGRSILETKGSMGKVSVWVQELKPETVYSVCLIFPRRDSFAMLTLFNLHVDAKGKAEERHSVDATNINGSGFSLTQCVAVAVIVPKTPSLTVPLCGYKDGMVRWRHGYIDLSQKAVSEKSEKTEQPISRLSEAKRDETTSGSIDDRTSSNAREAEWEPPIAKQPLIEESPNKVVFSVTVPKPVIQMDVISGADYRAAQVAAIAPEEYGTAQAATIAPDEYGTQAATIAPDEYNMAQAEAIAPDEYNMAQAEAIAPDEYDTAQAEAIAPEKYNTAQAEAIAPDEYNMAQAATIAPEEYDTAQAATIAPEEYDTAQAEAIAPDEYNMAQAEAIAPDEYNMAQAEAIAPDEYNMAQAATIIAPEDYDTAQAAVIAPEEYNAAQAAVIAPEEYNATQVTAIAPEEYETAQTAAIQPEEYDTAQDINIAPAEYNTVQATAIQPEEYDTAQAATIAPAEYDTAQATANDTGKDEKQQDIPVWREENIHHDDGMSLSEMAKQFHQALERFSNGLSEEPPQTLSETIEQKLKILFDKNIPMYPFRKQKRSVQWVRLSLNDPLPLPVDAPGLLNEAFVVSSYRLYNHLILGRTCDEGKRQYIVGVPGVYDSQTRTQAVNLRFSQFKSCDDTKTNQGAYGYWLMFINA